MVVVSSNWRSQHGRDWAGHRALGYENEDGGQMGQMLNR